MSTLGDVGESRLEAKILAALPATNRAVGTEDCVKALTVIAGLILAEFVGLGLQSVCRSVTRFVTSVEEKKTPNWTDCQCNDLFLQQVKSAIELFATFVPPASAGDGKHCMAPRQ